MPTNILTPATMGGRKFFSNQRPRAVSVKVSTGETVLTPFSPNENGLAAGREITVLPKRL